MQFRLLTSVIPRKIVAISQSGKLLGGKDVNESIQSLGSFEFSSDNSSPKIFVLWGSTFHR